MSEHLEGRRKRFPGPKKARKILRDNEIRGNPLTEKQRRLFGLIAGGGRPIRLRNRPQTRRRRRKNRNI